MRLRPRFRAVDSTLRSVAKSFAPRSKWNPPETFMQSFINRALLCLIGREGHPSSAQEAQRIRLLVPQPQRRVVPVLARPQLLRPRVAPQHRPHPVVVSLLR